MEMVQCQSQGLIGYFCDSCDCDGGEVKTVDLMIMWYFNRLYSSHNIGMISSDGSVELEFVDSNLTPSIVLNICLSQVCVFEYHSIHIVWNNLFILCLLNEIENHLKLQCKFSINVDIIPTSNSCHLSKQKHGYHLDFLDTKQHW